MEERTCPNCGSVYQGEGVVCPNCGAARYPRAAKPTSKEERANWRFGRPLARSTALTLLIAGGILFGFMGGCGLLVGLGPGSPDTIDFRPVGWFFAVIGFGVLAYLIFEFRRSRKDEP